ncbi:hypothetical protein [Moorella sulfitireducens (nom. illeg.)]|uniref:hypothetical protein n=1 Tax=Neomoorella sulfitireducens TaxID=2972948 RepID=UPI0021AC5C0A|nr:hypothetical protein [Moorella sulfitireducens]
MRNSRLENEILQRVDELVQCAISVSLKDETSRAEQLARGITMVKEMGDLLLEVLEGREQHLQALLEQLVAQRLPDRRILQSFGSFPRDIQHIISEGINSYLQARREGSQAPESAGIISPTPPESAEMTGNKSVPEESPASGKETGMLTASGEPLPFLEPQENPEASPPEAEDLQGQEQKENPPVEAGKPPGLTTGDPLDNALAALHLALLQVYPEEEIVINYETRGGKIPFFLPRLQIGFEPASHHYDWRRDFYCRRQGISIRRVADDELANPLYLARRLRREAGWRQTN